MNAGTRIEPHRDSGQEDDAERLASPVPARRVGAIDDLQLYSEHVQELLGVPPRWLVRWGITVIFGILVLLLALGWVIRYPDVVPASIVITTPSPPFGVVAQAGGPLTDVRVRNGEPVLRGALLAVVGNSAEPAAVSRLKDDLAALGPDLDRPNLGVDFAENLPLGELQGEYSTFVRSYEALRLYAEQDPVGREIRSLEPQLARHRERLDGFLRQHAILTREVGLAERDYRRAAELTSRRVLPEKGLEDKERELLRSRLALGEVEADIADARLDIDKVAHGLAQLRLHDDRRRQDLRLAFAEACKNLRSRLAVWERTYVLRAPIEGRVGLFRFWSDHQFVRAGDEVLTIVPHGDQPPVGKMTMPLANSGKVKPGQTVLIRLDNYPYQEFGLLKGIVQSISPVPRQAHYAIEVALPDGLSTSFDRRLSFQQEMQGGAEIVTEDLRLLERIFYQLRKLLMGGGRIDASRTAEPAEAT